MQFCRNEVKSTDFFSSVLWPSIEKLKFITQNNQTVSKLHNSLIGSTVWVNGKIKMALVLFTKRLEESFIWNCYCFSLIFLSSQLHNHPTINLRLSIAFVICLDSVIISWLLCYIYLCWWWRPHSMWAELNVITKTQMWIKLIQLTSEHLNLQQAHTFIKWFWDWINSRYIEIERDLKLHKE